MTKKRKNFDFLIPINRTSTINYKVQSVLIGNIKVAGVYRDRDDFDYETVEWEGADIWPLLDNCTAANDLREFIDAAVMHHMAEEEVICEPDFTADRAETVDLMHGIFNHK